MSTIDLKKIITLFTDRKTSQLSDQHSSAIRKLCVSRIHEAQGFFYQELPDLAEVINLTRNSIQEGHVSCTISILNIEQFELIVALLSLLQLAKCPFSKKRASDETKHINHLPIYLNSLSPLLRMGYVNQAILLDQSMDNISPQPTNQIQFDPNQIAIAAANVISDFASQGVLEIKQKEASYQDKMIHGPQSSPLLRLHQHGNRNLIALSNSDVPNSLISFLAAKQNSLQAIIATIQAVGHCAQYRPISQKFSQLGLLKDLVQTVGETDNFRSYIVRISMEAIWNIIEVAGEKATQTMSVQEVVFALRKVFERVLRDGYKLDDKHLRNELLVLINYCAMNFQSHSYFMTKEEGADQKQTFFELLLYYATYDELNSAKVKFLGTGTSKSIKPFFTTKEEDIEFKKVIWLSIFYIVRNESNEMAHQIMIEKEFLQALLIYLDPSQSNTAMHNWQAPQLKDLQLQALMTISNCIPIAYQHFHEISGHLTLAQFLSYYQDPQRQMRCLKALYSTSRYEMYKVDFAEKGTMKNLLDLIYNSDNNGLQMREIAFNTIANLCSQCRANQKQFRRKGGVEILITNLKLERLILNASHHRQLGSQGGNNVQTYLVSVVDCLFNSVLNNKRSELDFINLEGVNILIDLLEQCEECLKRLIISALCTLMENVKAKHYFNQWNSEKTAISATQLLIKLYEVQDSRHGVQRENGVLLNTERPLNPKTSYLLRKKKLQQLQKEENLIGGILMSSTQEHWKNKAVNSQSPHHSSTSHHDFATNLNKSRGGVDEDQNNMSRLSNQPGGQAKDKNKSPIVTGLIQKLETAQQEKDLYSESYFNQKMVNNAHLHDLRGSIFCLLYRVGFDLHELNAKERQTLLMIQLYPLMLSGEIWRDIKEELQDVNLKPIADDKHWMETSIETCQQELQKSKYRQIQLASQMQGKQLGQLQDYYTALRLKFSTNKASAAAAILADTKGKKSANRTSRMSMVN